MTAAKANTNATLDHSAPASPATALWRIAVSTYESELASYGQVSAEHSAAERAFQAELGEPNPEFAEMHWALSADKRAEAVRDVEIAVIMRDYSGRDHITADEHADVARKAATLVDERAAYKARSAELHERLVADVDKRWEKACDTLYEARERVFSTACPDMTALRYKLEVLASYVRECDGEDASHIESVRDDLNRLTQEG